MSGMSFNPNTDGGGTIVGNLPWAQFRIECSPEGEISGEYKPIIPPAMPPAPPKKPRPTVKQLLTGAAGLLKAEFGLDPVDDQTYERRKLACRFCDNFDFGVCLGERGCNCYLAAKIRLKKQRCPLSKW